MRSRSRVAVPEHLQERLRRADGCANGAGPGDHISELGKLRFEGRLLLADLLHLRVQPGVSQSAAPEQTDDPSPIGCLLLMQSFQVGQVLSGPAGVLNVRFQPGLELLEDWLRIAQERFDIRPNLRFQLVAADSP